MILYLAARTCSCSTVELAAFEHDPDRQAVAMRAKVLTVLAKSLEGEGWHGLPAEKASEHMRNWAGRNGHQLVSADADVCALADVQYAPRPLTGRLVR